MHKKASLLLNNITKYINNIESNYIIMYNV
nr:MAG TPA: hypothetical protein [Caudoviricetes sp.]